MDDAFEFRAPETMTPGELGDNLARLVWESFSDFLAEEDTEIPLSEIYKLSDDEDISHRTAEEALIFFMWAHTRSAQQAFLGRAPDDRIRDGLDALHRAVFEDMVEHGTPESQLPFFEQRVSARYAEYHQAVAESVERLGDVVSKHIIGDEGQIDESAASALQSRAVAVAGPLGDFLEEVELVEA